MTTTNYIFESLSSLAGSYPDTSTKFHEAEQGKATHRQYEDLEGNSVSIFTDNLIKVLDTAIMSNNKHLLTKEQEAYFIRYCTEADSTLSPEMVQFDTFLGTYTGGTDE